MPKELTFRQDIRRKLIFFGLVPMLLVGSIAGWLVYQSEVSLMVSEHTRLLRTVERLADDYYRRVHLFFNVVHNKITQGELSAINAGFDFAPDFYSVLVLDRHGNVTQSYCRYDCGTDTVRLNRYQKALVDPILHGKESKRGAVYYDAHENTILLSHAFNFEDKIYVISSNAESFFSKLAYYIQKRTHRSISIVNEKGVYIYDSIDPNRVIKEQIFFHTSAFLGAVSGHDPYTLIEYPAHYQKGGSFWKGLMDEDHYLSYAHLSNFDWIVTVTDHTDSIDQYLQRVLTAAIILLIVTMMLTVWSANMMTQHIVVPVERLMRNIDAFARDKSGQESVAAAYPIFRSLVDSFNTMRSRIVARETKLREQIEENSRIQEQLVQQEKQAAMGEMIGNIAHQWRQPLSVISTLATGLQTEQELGLATEERVRETCTQINDNAQYLSGTIDDFRQFIKGDHKKTDFTAEDLIESLINLMQGQLKRHAIHVDVLVEKDTVIHGYRNDLLQVLINLLSNAKDALLENRETDRLIRLIVEPDGERTIKIRMIDNGGGIKEAIIQRIFEPYFTTKHKSQGTGLGLHMVHRLIHEGMGGTIGVKTITFMHEESSCTGAEFTITLPIDPQGDDDVFYE